MKVARQTYACLIRKIATYCDTSQTVLEIATGTGTIALALADHARQVHGCDISPAMLEIARRKLNQLHYTNVEFTVQDACQLTYPADSFDLVIAANTLHVMLQPQAALQAIRNVLKANGKLIAPTYCHGQSLVSRSLSAVMSLAGFKAFQKWSLDGYRSFLMEHGFQITEWEVIADSIPLVFAVAMKRSQS